jgi:DNA invertase Pin-like site-specific DNA recombinase
MLKAALNRALQAAVDCYSAGATMLHVHVRNPATGHLSADFDQYCYLLVNTVEQGDTVIVTRLDRLARSTRDLLNVLAKIGEQGAGFRSLGDAWADTTTPHGRLMLTVLGGLAEFERELIRARTGEGRSRAVARGVKLGRSPKLTPHQQREALARREAGETLADIARTFGVHHSTISRLS